MPQPVRLVLIVATLAAFAAACSKDSPTSPSEQAQLAVTPNAGAQGSAVPITITGTNFTVGSVFEGTLSGGGVAVSRITVLDPATAVATVTIGPDAALGARTFTFTAPSGATFSAPFTITVPVPTLTAIGPSTAVSGTSAIFTLSGAAFGTGTTVAVSGAGVTVSEVNVNDSTILTARFTVDAAADLGPRTVTVTTPTGSATQTLNIVPPAPVLTALTPASGVNGTTVNVTVSGSNFVPGATTVAVSGSGVTTQIVSGPQVTATGRSMVVAFIIDANAAQGSRSVTVSTSGGTSAALPFNVGSAAGFPTIGSFTATPATIVPGGSSILRWSGVTNATTCSINNGIGDVTCADGAVGVSPSSTTEYQFMATGPGGREWIYTLVLVEPSGSQTFNFTGAAQTFTVPNGVTLLTVNAFGAQGGAGDVGGPAGGLGGSVTARIAVTPGETLTITVGGAGGAGTPGVPGSGGFNGGGIAGAGGSPGGGGGGASDVRQGGTALGNRVVVAGGGGGSGTLGSGGVGGAGGGLTGGNGTAGAANPGNDGNGGGGGTAAAGGAGGTGNPTGTDGQAGASGQGGAGGAGVAATGGGAGGGFFGGGGGEGASAGAGTGGGGGGGSSFTIGGATSVAHAQGVRTGSGQIVITW